MSSQINWNLAVAAKIHVGNANFRRYLSGAWKQNRASQRYNVEAVICAGG